MRWRSKRSLEPGLEVQASSEPGGLWATLGAVVGERRAPSAAAVATVAASIGDRTRALEMLSQLAARHPSAGFEHVARAFYQRQVGDDAAALASFEQATIVDPSNAEAWLGLGCMLDDRGHAEALPTLERSTQLAPHHAECWCRYGDALAATGNYARALDAYERAIALHANHARAAFHRCRALGALGQLEAAVEATPRAAARDLGELRECRRVSRGRVFVCRYWAADDVADLFEVLAETLLSHAQDVGAADLALDDGVCVDAGCSPLRVIVRDGVFVVCDADAGRSLRADRFGEVNEAISLLYAQQMCLRSAGLEGEPCRWTDLVFVQLEALEQPHIRLRRTMPSVGESGWTLLEGGDEPLGAASCLELHAIPVFELRRRRPALTRFLTLPIGIEAEIDGNELVALHVLGDEGPTDRRPVLH